MPSRNSFASVIAAAKSQAAVTGLVPEPASPTIEPTPADKPPAESAQRESSPPPARPARSPRVSPPTPPAAPPTPPAGREHGRPEAISWAADLTASRQGDWLTVYGVPVPLPKGTDEELVTMSFRCPRWLREAVHMRCRQYGVEVQEFGQASLAVVLAQLQAAEQTS